MISVLTAVLLCSAAVAAPAPAPHPAAAPAGVSTAAVAGAAAPPALGVSTYTVETLYTGDHYRDPFLSPSMGTPSRTRDKNAPFVLDIHELQLRGIMQDKKSDFAIFSTASGMTLILRGNRLYDDHSKPVPGVTGRIMLKQKRAQLVTADKDVQVYKLGEDDEEDKSQQMDEP
jgi:hypothetical protein